MKELTKVDAHQHFWRYNPAEFSWIGEDQITLQGDFLPQQLSRELNKSGFTHSIAVQARQSLEETRWLLTLAEQYPFISGVIGWVDLRSSKVAEQLLEFSAHPAFKGVRHVLQDEQDDRFMLEAKFLEGIGLLRKFKLVYELLIYPKQLQAAKELVSLFPRQRFVLDHIGKPDIKHREFDFWAKGIQDLAGLPNVSVKVSGMITEANHKTWSAPEFYPYMKHVWDCFGEDRILFGSDWPVCLAAGTHAQVTCLAEGFFDQFPVSVRRKVFGANARRIYRL